MEKVPVYSTVHRGSRQYRYWRLLEEALRLPEEALKLPEEALRLPEEALRLHEEALRLPEEALRLPEKMVRLRYAISVLQYPVPVSAHFFLAFDDPVDYCSSIFHLVSWYGNYRWHGAGVEPLIAGREGQIHPAGPDRGGALHPTQLHTLVEVRRSLPSVQYFGQVH